DLSAAATAETSGAGVSVRTRVAYCPLRAPGGRGARRRSANKEFSAPVSDWGRVQIAPAPPALRRKPDGRLAPNRRAPVRRRGAGTGSGRPTGRGRACRPWGASLTPLGRYLVRIGHEPEIHQRLLPRQAPVHHDHASEEHAQDRPNSEADHEPYQLHWRLTSTRDDVILVTGRRTRVTLRRIAMPVEAPGECRPFSRARPTRRGRKLSGWAPRRGRGPA
ncbi:MAG: hypothetical protein QOK04_843, partial [Solirubrobacteraceae bacterium]|nr:hypothetical protein [Solirubrobacteraceae bacterium]